MVTLFDASPNDVIEIAAKQLKEKITKPSWALVVKTGTHKQRPPVDPDWWFVRAAAVLRTVYIQGPIGVQKLRRKYGGKKKRGVVPEEFRKGSGSILRKILQELQKCGFVEPSKNKIYKGRVITGSGRSFMDNAAFAASKTEKPVKPVPVVHEEKAAPKEAPVKEAHKQAPTHAAPKEAHIKPTPAHAAPAKAAPKPAPAKPAPAHAAPIKAQ